ncbi:DsbA family protein [Melghirimyces algeriensis]|uniref:Protein-disulfide isomerase n=1 Tax=Melghirimyces algeriensis TaxID=910412 RepID=A0A521EKT4_9BACL|nr:thioredoxin domain-containing protein [Melghirimyces algeriensis]SMO84524.1 Protein-disulfide isomerase [Melghirimyces algeriensis]
MGKNKAGQGNKTKKKQARTNRMQTLTLGTLILVFLGLGGYALVDALIGKEDVQQEKTTDTVKEEIFQYDKQPVLGDENAKVKIVEFGDYKCPSCKKFEENIFPKLKKDYMDSDQVGFYFVNNPFLGEDSVTAAIAGEAVYNQDPDAFWTFYQKVYEEQGAEHETWATKEFLVNLAKKELPDLDHKKLEKAIEEGEYEEDVQQDKAITQQARVNLVPTLFINGKKVSNPFDYAQIKQMIEEELNK